MRKQPEKLTLALETLFRLQAVESQVSSLVDGVRRYQNGAVGDLLVSVMSANSANRDQLRQYITDLAKTKEQEFQIVDSEAQRQIVRAVLVRKCRIARQMRQAGLVFVANCGIFALFPMRIIT